MTHSPGIAASRDAGLSLIEVTVVVAILSILAVGTLFSVSRSPAAGAEIEKLTKGYAAARTDAITAQKPVALELTATGWNRQIWQSGRSGAAAEHWEKQDPETTWAIPPANPRALPVRVTFLPTGRSSGVSLQFLRADGGIITCSANAWGALKCTGL